jgi:undecaprenyl-diphosphatase
MEGLILNTRTRIFWIGTILALSTWLLMLLLSDDAAALNEQIYRSLYAADDRVLARMAWTISVLGGWIALSTVTILGAIALALKRRRRAALLLIAVFGGRFLIELQKIVFNHPRPSLSQHLTSVESMSFPSAHAGNSMITYLAIALLVPIGIGLRTTAVGIALLLAGFIGLSRIVLGVHWPSDVVGGWAFGILWVLFCMRLASIRPEAEPTPGAP